MKKMLCLLLALLLAAFTATAFASGYVYYEGGAENFVFLPGSEYSDTDLFAGFKDVMPGDTISQRILVMNKSDRWIRLYMRADPIEESDRDFLSRLNLQVKSKDTEIFDAATSETAQLTENYFLGTFNKNGSTELILTLTVPLDLNNDYMNRLGVIPWTFLLEELPADYEPPKTGDAFELSTWLLAAAMIIGAIAFVLIRMKKERTNA